MASAWSLSFKDERQAFSISVLQPRPAIIFTVESSQIKLLTLTRPVVLLFAPSYNG